MDLSGSLSESIHSTVVSLMRERATRRQQNRQQRVCGFISAAASPTSGPQIDPAAQTVLSPLPKHLTAFFGRLSKMTICPLGYCGTFGRFLHVLSKTGAKVF